MPSAQICGASIAPAASGVKRREARVAAPPARRCFGMVTAASVGDATVLQVGDDDASR